MKHESVAENLKEKINKELNYFLDQVYKISNLRKGDIVFRTEVQPMDMDYFAAVILDTNAYEGYITVIDVNEQKLKHYYTFETIKDLAEDENDNELVVRNRILNERDIYNIRSQVLIGEFDYLLKY